MSEKEKEKENVNAKKESKPRAQVFTLEKLRENCVGVLGVSQSTFDGAMRGAKGSMTVEEAKRAIDKWGQSKIKREEK